MYPAIRLMCSRTGRIGRLQNLDLYTCALYLICSLIVCFVCRHLSQSQQSFFYAISLKQCKNMLIPYFSLQDLSFGPYQIPWEALRSGWGPCWRPWPPWIPSSWVAPSCRAWSIRSSSSSPSCTYQNLGSLLCPSPLSQWVGWAFAPCLCAEERICWAKNRGPKLSRSSVRLPGSCVPPPS